jgi:hypothetical protein
VFSEREGTAVSERQGRSPKKSGTHFEEGKIFDHPEQVSWPLHLQVIARS